MTDEQLTARLKSLAGSERKITAEILELIRVADRRKLFLKGGFSSTFEWLVRELGYSQPCAYRRIQAARLLADIPALGEKLERGSLNLTHVVQVQVAAKREEKRTGEKVSVNEKIELFALIENMTTEAAQRVIKERFPESGGAKDSLRRINGKESRLNVVVSDDCRSNIERSREILSHVIPDGRLSEVVEFVFHFFIDEKDPLQKLTHRLAAKNNHRVITPALRAFIIKRANGQCEFIDDKTQRRCESRFQIEVDHIHPKSLGGTNHPKNLRALCRPHNQYEAERILGPR